MGCSTECAGNKGEKPGSTHVQGAVFLCISVYLHLRFQVVSVRAWLAETEDPEG